MNGIREFAKRDPVINPRPFANERQENQRPVINQDTTDDLGVVLVSSQKEYDLFWAHEIARVHQRGFASEAVAHKTSTHGQFYLDTKIQLADRDCITLSCVDTHVNTLSAGTTVDLLCEAIPDFEGKYEVIECVESNAGIPRFGYDGEHSGTVSNPGNVYELKLVEQ
jgi:hypothetical protein